jgi:hypothetical protein
MALHRLLLCANACQGSPPTRSMTAAAHRLCRAFSLQHPCYQMHMSAPHHAHRADTSPPCAQGSEGRAGGARPGVRPRLVHGGHRGVECSAKVDRVAPERRRAEAPAGGQDHRGAGRQRRQQACGAPGAKVLKNAGRNMLARHIMSRPGPRCAGLARRQASSMSHIAERQGCSLTMAEAVCLRLNAAA